MNDLRIYKPNKDVSRGAASTVQIAFKTKTVKGREGKPVNVERVLIFWNIAQQTGVDGNGNASFDWDNSVKAMLGDPDIGEILLVLQGRKDAAGLPGKGDKPASLYHRNKNGNTVIQFSAATNGSGFYISISTQRDGVNARAAHGISFSEGIILEQLLKDYITRKYGWVY